MDYKFKFITLAGFPALHYGIFSLAREFNKRGIPAHAELQQADFAAESLGCSATRHQREVGSGYFDEVSVIISRGESSTTALRGSTETEQFHRQAIARRQAIWEKRDLIRKNLTTTEHSIIPETLDECNALH